MSPSNVTEYMFFWAAHGTFSRIGHIPGYKASLNKYRKTEVIPFILPDHNRKRLQMNSKRNPRTHMNS